MLTLFAIVSKDENDCIIRVRFKPYLPNNGYDLSWIQGKLLVLGYDDMLVLKAIDAKYFNIEECTLVVLE